MLIAEKPIYLQTVYFVVWLSHLVCFYWEKTKKIVE